MKAILGHKIGMTQIWDDKGRLLPATVIQALPNTVLNSSDSGSTLGLAVRGKGNKAQDYLAKKASKKERGKVWVKEFSGLNTEEKELNVDQFIVGDKVKITGTTKGKGFSGTIKRHNFHRGPVSHGSDNVRRPGSIGAQRPQRVPKGKKMAGQMGNVQFTARGNKVLAVDLEKNVLVVSGAVPGANHGQVIIQTQE